jgi:hypothetical protein
VRRHAKTSSARSRRSIDAADAAGRVWVALVAASFFALLLLTFGVNGAAAETASERPLLFTFNGSDTSAGGFIDPTAIDIDQTNGVVYVVDESRGVIDKFNLAGVAQNFSSTASSSLDPGMNLQFSGIAVDNSSTNQGRIYLTAEFGPLQAFSPAGESLWSAGGLGIMTGVAVDPSGHPWIGAYGNELLREFATTGSPPTQISSFSTAPNRPGGLEFDASGNVYVDYLESVDSGAVDKYVDGVKDSTLDAGPAKGVALDRSSASGHIFTLHDGSFNEYDSSGTLLGTYGAGTIGSGFHGAIAYDASTDRVYVSDPAAHTVEVFGPAATGTVPDATLEPSTEVGVTKATFHGTVNPQGVANSYHFEWKEGASSPWGSAESSPSFSLPVDSNDHAVSYTTTALRGGRGYQVRLVGVNTDNDLRGVSGTDTFSTSVASAAPTVSIDQISPITQTTAHVAATIDTHEDLTEWQLEVSTDPACGSGFESKPIHAIPGGHTSADAASEDLTGLLPAEHYCVRLRATNSAGVTTSSIEAFETPEGAPSQVFTAYAAPRTDTTARLNGYVNPEGVEATYRFEYSQDGSSWTAVPEQQTSEARRQIVVGEEVSGLQPNTTYHYRFSAENGAGAASPQGDEKTFTTRTTAEMQPPKRGIELVNQPDKGNQNISNEGLLNQPMTTEDGNKALWTVTGGAPGANAGTFATFVAIRTGEGWKNRSVIPAPEDQLGGGGLAYRLNEANQSFTGFLFRVASSGATTEGTPALVRTNDLGQQNVLEVFNNSLNGYRSTEMTEDLSDVLFVNPSTRQLENVSASPEVVSLMPDGTPNECGLEATGQSFTGSGSEGASRQWRAGYRRMARTDGSRVYFQAVPNGRACGSKLAIFYRDRNAEQTTEIDQGGDSSESSLIRATPDGRSVYFVSDVPHAPSDGNTTNDVYRWDSETGEYTCLTCVVAEAAVEGRVLVSDDFSHVYFTSKKQLLPGYGNAGDRNLYVLRGGTLGFVVDLGGDTVLGPNESELSKDGNVLAFETSSFTYQTLTADRLAESCRGGFEGDCTELFRYEDSKESLECVSCRADAVTHDALGARFSFKTFGLSKDGSTAALLTREPIVNEDINDWYDIYEWRNGTLRLITDGETHYPVGLGGTSPMIRGLDNTGDNIFFSLVDPGLTGYEQDGLANLYDARVGGGFPRPQPPAHCSEESCQGPLQAAPSQPSAGSQALAGAGNVASEHKGRCAGRRGKPRSRCLHSHKKHHKGHKQRAAKRNAGGAK